MIGDWLDGDSLPDEPLGGGDFEPAGFDAAAVQHDTAYQPEAWTAQTTDFTCAVVSQQMILEEFGIEVSEAELVYEATSGGLLTDGGTSPEDMGRLLEMHGVAVHQGYGLNALVDDLAHGRKAIVAVDSGELWGHDSTLEDMVSPYGADHAVVVTGLDLSDPANPRVVINDPGHPDGAAQPYPLDQFLDAWSDSTEFFVATDEPPPDLAAEPVLGSGFHADAGMYMDGDYWSQFKERFLGNLADNTGAVADRFMAEGDLGESLAAAVIKSATDSLQDLTEPQRNSLFRTL